MPTIRATSLAVACCAVLLAGCSGDDSGSTTAVTTTGDAGTTSVSTADPQVPRAPSLPDAFLTAPSGMVQLASYGGCWTREGGVASVCADPIEVTCPAPGIPDLDIEAGDELRLDMDLPARPSEVTLRPTGSRKPTTLKPPATTTRWTASGETGLAVVGASVPGYGNAAWAVCFV
ncbi:MAG: hypothetical protein H6531_06765 [Actinobacteria bacterium]|nr:hypothetical protein [Actinomycetota bacterium]